jgi:chemotaxis protein methyltransferase CheR
VTQQLSPDLLTRVSGLVAERMGLHFGPDRWVDLQRGLTAAATELGLAGPEAYAQRLLSGPLRQSQIDVLAGHLTVSETYFFRDKPSFEVLKTVLRDLVQARRGHDQSLRIWSAGCSSGEEAYSVAMVVSGLIHDSRNWRITLLATDVNARALRRAAAGIYSDWSFRDCPPALKERYFRQVDGTHYEILPHVKRLVTFAYLNLAADVYPSLFNNTNAMDLILCRNVLMYFVPEQVVKVASQLEHCLVEGGWLLCSPAESLNVHGTRLRAVMFPGAVLYQKATNSLATPPPAPPVKHVSAAPADLAESTHAASLPAPPIQPGPATVRPVTPKKVYAEALARYQQGCYAEAAALLEHTVGGDADEVRALELLVRVYADQGQLAAALRWSDRAIAADKLSPGGYYLRSTILQEQGALEEAAQCLQRALYLDRNFVLAHFALGSLARRQGRPSQAYRHLRIAAELLSDCPADALVPESDGVTVGRLQEIIAALLARETAR